MYLSLLYSSLEETQHLVICVINVWHPPAPRTVTLLSSAIKLIFSHVNWSTKNLYVYYYTSLNSIIMRYKFVPMITCICSGLWVNTVVYQNWVIVGVLESIQCMCINNICQYTWHSLHYYIANQEQEFSNYCLHKRGQYLCHLTFCF